MATQIPSVFIGHGSPMNTLEVNGFTEAWCSLGERIPRPRAILAISAHWYIPGTVVTSMAAPRTIHDFYGFPPELFEVQYNAPGSPELASSVINLLSPLSVSSDDHQWGLDHGTWSVLVHMFPNADIPVVQFSIDSTLSIEEHFAIGQRLAPLAADGVLIMGSGNVVHNLSRINWAGGNTGFDWANRFDAHVANIMTSDPSQISSVTSHDDWAMSAPTPEHFLPLVYIAGIASAQQSTVTPFNYERTLGSLSMTSYIADLV